jgi:hypothetical protein
LNHVVSRFDHEVQAAGNTIGDKLNFCPESTGFAVWIGNQTQQIETKFIHTTQVGFRQYPVIRCKLTIILSNKIGCKMHQYRAKQTCTRQSPFLLKKMKLFRFIHFCLFLWFIR